MKITAVETHACHARMRNWIFAKVLTNQLELVGWGKAPLEWHTRNAGVDIALWVIGGKAALHVAHLCAPKNRDMIGSVQLCDGGISLVTAAEINDQK